MVAGPVRQDSDDRPSLPAARSGSLGRLERGRVRGASNRDSGTEGTRPAQACDQCNHRKIKCRPSNLGTDICYGCERAEIACTWSRPAQRRGPKRKSRHPIIQPRTQHDTDVTAQAGSSSVAGPSPSPNPQSSVTEPRDLTLDPVSFAWPEDLTLGQDPGLVAASLDPIFSPGQQLHPGPSHVPPPTGLPPAQPYNWTSTPTALSATRIIEELPIDTSFTPLSGTDATAAWQLFWSILPMVSDQTSVSAPFDISQAARIEEQVEQVHINWHSLESVGSEQGYADGSQTNFLDHGSAVLAAAPTTLTAESVVLCATEQIGDPILLHAMPPLPEPPDGIRERIKAHFQWLGPVLPVLHFEEMMTALEEAAHERSIHFRALVLSMCAMTVVSHLSDSQQSHFRGLPNSESLKSTYLRDAQRANALADSDGDSSIADVVTSLHLFLAFEWLKDHQRSWDYLQQAITRAQALKIDRLGNVDVEGRDPLDASEAPLRGVAWWATRLRLYYLLILIERAHALLRPASMYHNQALRLPGRPWLETQHLRTALPDFALNGLQTGLIRTYDLVDDRWIRCYRSHDTCRDWTPEHAAKVQNELGEHFDDIVNSRFGVTKDNHEGMRLIVTAVTVAWLRDIIFRICLSHSLVHESSPYAAMRPSFVLHNMRQAVSAPRLRTEYHQIAGTDHVGEVLVKLQDITMTAVRTVELLRDQQRALQGSTPRGQRMGREESGEGDLVKSLTDVIIKSMGILCLAVRDQAALSKLVQAVGRIT